MKFYIGVMRDRDLRMLVLNHKAMICVDLGEVSAGFVVTLPLQSLPIWAECSYSNGQQFSLYGSRM